MSMTISANNSSVTVADDSSVTVTGTGDTVSTNSSTISFIPAGSLSVAGTGDTVNLQTPGSTLNLAGTGSTETVNVTSVTNTSSPAPYVINASGDSVALSSIGTDSSSNIIVNGSGDTLSLTNVGFSNTTTLALNGNNDTLSVSGSTNPVPKITIAGTGDAVTVNGSTMISLAANSSAAITGNNDRINVTTGDTVTVTGSNDTIFGSGASVMASNSSVTFSGTNNSNTVSADDAIILLNGLSTLTVSGTGDTLELLTPGSTLNLTSTGANEEVLVAAVTNTSSPSPYVINVSGDSVGLSDPGSSSSGTFSSIIVNGSGDTLSLSKGGLANTTLMLNGNNDTLGVSVSNITGFMIGATIGIAGTGDAVTASGSAITLNANSSATISGSHDTINVTTGDTVTVAGDRDIINVSGSGSTVTLTGNNGTVTGGPGGNTLGAGGSNDIVHGGTGNDTLLIEGGTDTFFGGGGNDIFKVISATFVSGLNQPQNLIADFNFANSNEKIDLSALTSITSFADLSFSTVTFNGQSFLLITLGNTGQAITLEGVKANQLSANNFIFAPSGPIAPILDPTPVESFQFEGHQVFLGRGVVTPQFADDPAAVDTVVISGIPAGGILVSISSGTTPIGTPTLDADGNVIAGSITLSASDAADARLLLPETDAATVTLSIQAQASKGGQTAVSSIKTDTIHVLPLAVAPTLTVIPASSAVDEGGTVGLAITPTVATDPDAVTTVTVSGLGSATLSAGQVNADGSVTLQLSDLPGLTLQAADDDTPSLHLTVTASTNDNGSIATSAPATIDLAVNPRADASLGSADVPAALTVVEDAIVPFVITPHFEVGDADASNLVIIRGLPVGASLLDSQGNTIGEGGTDFVLLTEDQLPGLQLRAPADTSQFTLQINAQSSEGFDTFGSTPVGVTVYVTPFATDNTFISSPGQTTLIGAPGNDTLIAGWSGIQTFIGGAGNNVLIGTGAVVTADYVGATEQVIANLATGSASDNGFGGTDSLINIDGLLADGTGDQLTGGAVDGTLLEELGSGNTLTAGIGNTELFGLAGNNTFNGGPGQDQVVLGGGGNVVNGDGIETRVNYIINIDASVNIDFTNGVGIASSSAFTHGNDTLNNVGFLVLSNNSITVEAGANALLVQVLDSTNSTITGTTGSLDVLFSSAGSKNANNVVNGSSGNDVIEVVQGQNDTINAGSGTTLLQILGDAGGQSGVDSGNVANLGSGSTTATITADGTTVNAGSGTFTVTASGNDDILAAGTGSGTFNLTGINGIYQYAAGDGATTIGNTAGNGAIAANTLDFTGNLTDQNLWFQQSGNDLQIDVLGSQSEVTLANWFNGGTQLQEITAGGLKIDSQVSQLVQAMATYSANNPGFDPTASNLSSIPNDANLQNSIAAAWHA